MELLTFAHRGEAKAFLKRDQFEPISFAFDGLYKNNQRFLLIHGEGSQVTSEKVSAVCGAFRDKIHAVINLGVCGSLNQEKFKIDSIFPIRTCYKEDEFKSFSTANKSGVDLICSKERILDLEKAKKLSWFAPIVDREAWAVGSVCHTLDIPFYAFKLVSDYSNNEDICQLVSAKSEEISEALYRYFLEIKIDHRSEERGGNSDGTVSQKRLHDSFLKKMELKGITPSPLNEDFKNLGPKKRMAKVLEQMEKDLFPFENRLRQRLNSLTQELRDAKIEVKFSKDYEDPTISLTTKVKSQKELDKIISALKSLPLKEIRDVFDGKINV